MNAVSRQRPQKRIRCVAACALEVFADAKNGPVRGAFKWGQSYKNAHSRYAPSGSAAIDSSKIPREAAPAGKLVYSRRQCEAFHDLITQKLEIGLDAQRAYQDFVRDHGFPVSYFSVRRFAASRKPMRRNNLYCSHLFIRVVDQVRNGGMRNACLKMFNHGIDFLFGSFCILNSLDQSN